jgi:excisionase family DNA binding protein
MSDWLNTDEAAAIIRKSRDYVARQCKAGAIRATKLGNDWRIHRSALEAFMGLDEIPATRPNRERRVAR